MREINKLRQRLINAGSSAREYRMTLQEAKDLLADIDFELAEIAKKVEHATKAPEPNSSTIQHVIMDGGSFHSPPGFSPPDGSSHSGSLLRPS